MPPCSYEVYMPSTNAIRKDDDHLAKPKKVEKPARPPSEPRTASVIHIEVGQIAPKCPNYSDI